MNRAQAEFELKRIFGLDSFYDEQWEAIERILRGERVLMIERTGFGKSLCYQFPATQFPGTTIVFSPLIALMRDQVKSLKRKGIPSAFINCEQLPEERDEVFRQALDGEVKILYIAPERLDNVEWKLLIPQITVSMVVIDEAHTISTWGHDFRLAFSRIVNLVQSLPLSTPVLATTATATERTQEDIEKQIGGRLTTIRGSLERSNLFLRVITVSSEEEKMLWIAENVNKFPGTGLIYVGTRTDTRKYANWLCSIGIDAVEYSAGLDADSRKEIEEGLLDNRWKCVVSTNALGMGIDKSDIRFIIHTQIPVSPIHYYQEIGRAGRDGERSDVVLFYNRSLNADGLAVDYVLPKHFIDNARPSRAKYEKVIELLREEPLSMTEIIKKANLKQPQVQIIKNDLITQGIVSEVKYAGRNVYEYRYDAPELDLSQFEELRRKRLKELDAMEAYVYASGSRMDYLRRYLDDYSESVSRNCDNTTLEKAVLSTDPELKRKLREFWDNTFPLLEVEGGRSKLCNGYAASYYGTSEVGAAIHGCKYEGGGDFPDFVLRLVLKAFRRYFEPADFDMVLYVPPTKSGDLVKNFAVRFASSVGLPISHGLVKVRETEEQKIYQSSIGKRDNVKDAFDIDEDEVAGKRIILIDDIYDSGVTVREIGKMLTARGAEKIVPVVVAKTVGGTL